MATRTVALLALLIAAAEAQSWTTLTNAPPAAISSCMLLTDGGVMCQSETRWYRLTPDSSGSYINGAWSSLAGFPSGYGPGEYASAVLANGRVVVVGGEFNFADFVLSKMSAIYDPTIDSWQMISPPTGAVFHDFQCIGDAPAAVLPNGRLLIGSKLFQGLATLDPSSLSWSLVTETGKNDPSDAEEGWTLLPDGSVFTMDVAAAPAAERLLLSGSAGVWVSAGNSPQNMQTPVIVAPQQAPGCPTYYPPGEMGPSVLRPDGTVFVIGANGFTAIYTPPPAGSMLPGSWKPGPALPGGLTVADGPAALLPSGRVLFGGSPGSGAGLHYFEFDGGSLISVPAPALSDGDNTSESQLLILPTGQVLFVDGTNLVQIYTPSASPGFAPACAPTITSAPSSVNNGATYPITGTQFNGLSQGTAYGDEQQNATNYPLVRITNNASGHVFYCRTHDHSTMAVATGAATVSTNFDVPASIEPGQGTLQVVANGIASLAIPVSVLTPNPEPLAVVINSLPGGQLNIPYTATLTATGGTMPYTWQLVSGALPSGLTLNPQTGTITGTPSAAAVAPLTFRVTDSSTPTPQAASVNLTLAVVSALTITTASLPGGQLNVPYNTKLTASGGAEPYSWQLVSGTLPNGLTLNTQTGSIAGIPTTTVTNSPLTFLVTDSSTPTQTASVNLTLTIAVAPLTISTTSLLPAQVNVPYGFALTASGGVTPYSWQLIGGVLPDGLTLNVKTGSIAGTPTTTATNVQLTFRVTDSSTPAPQTATVNLNLTVTPPALTITTTSLPNGVVNARYSAVLHATGGALPYVWNTRRLPDGLSLDPQTGTISGTPTGQVSSMPVTFTVADSTAPIAQTASATLTITINPASSMLTITTTSLPNGQVNAPYSAVLQATGGITPYSWKTTALPNGLSLDPQTGKISGIPTAPVTNAGVTVTVTDSSTPTAQTAVVALTLTVASAASTPLSITTNSLANAQANQPYSAVLKATGGVLPYTWSARRLPSGLTLNAQTGQISGTPTVAASSTPLIFTATDSSTPVPQTATTTLNLTILPSALAITTASLPDGQVNVPYSAVLTAAGGTTPYTWTVAQLPAGLTLDAHTGAISGAPISAAPNAPVTFTVTDSATPSPGTATAILSLNITSSARGSR
ncbi:MAG TPA: putative Ig domain-containing protein [Bryobacteraceae bacterium]|nr:putative Ig domain-containing protein [Bryobacteraceae bacterium]